MFAGLAEVCSVDDVVGAIQQQDLAFDLNEDQAIDRHDIQFLIEDVFRSRLGDANLDGRVSFEDFLAMSANFGASGVDYVGGDFDGSGSVGFEDFLELSANFGFASSGRMLSLKDGSAAIPNRTIFDLLSHAEDVPGAIGISEVKFVIELDRGEIYFSNSKQHAFHYHLAQAALGFVGGSGDFTQQAYFTDNRRFIAGSILAHDNFERADGLGLYTVEFWPTDPVKVGHVNYTMQLIADAMPFAADKIFYHAAGETQRELFAREAAIYTSLNTPTITTEELYGNQTFAQLNAGVAFGRLRVVDGNDGIPLSLRDLVIFKAIPNDLTHVAGVISVEPQTPLSHVNLRAKQNNTPNAYIKGALEDPLIQSLIGKNVRFEVINNGYTIREATAAEVEEHFDAIRPQTTQLAVRDLTRRDIIPLADLRTVDQTAYGAKAANLGELSRILPDEQVPDGLALPFALYDDFMKANGFYDHAIAMMARADFQSDPVARDRILEAFRDLIQDGDVPSDISAQLDAAYATLRQQHGDDAAFRARSSTNNEDLLGFTGAGLYRSYTHRPDEGKLENTIRQVWSSLWTFRAFEEREFWRIDHFTAAMGVAIHPNFDLEEVNGVAVTKNIYDPNWIGFYVNAQVGEELVTNPEDGAIPEEFLISAIGPSREWEVQYIRQSNLTENGQNVLRPVHVEQLRVAMLRIQNHFRGVYNAFGNREFAMDIEFKVDRNGQLVIKQARPWVD